MKIFEYKITQFKSYDKKAALKELNKFGKPFIRVDSNNTGNKAKGYTI